MRVKIWTADGRIVYSDEPRLIGSRYPLDDSKLEVLRTGGARAERSDARRTGESIRAGSGQPLRGLPPDSRARRDASALRDVSARDVGRIDGPSDLAPVRSAPARQPRPPLARPGAPRLATRTAPAPKPARSGDAARARRRGIGRRAAPHRRRPPRRCRPGPRGYLVLAQRGCELIRTADVSCDPRDSRRSGVRNARQHAAHPLAPRRDPSPEPPRRGARSCTRRPSHPTRGTRDRDVAGRHRRARPRRGGGAVPLSRGERGDPERRATR